MNTRRTNGVEFVLLSNVVVVINIKIQFSWSFNMLVKVRTNTKFCSVNHMKGVSFED